MPELTQDQAFTLALQHHQAGRLSDAREIYNQILAANPNHHGALHYLGVIAIQQNDNSLAIDRIRKSITLQPNNPAAHSDLGVALQAVGELDQAIAAQNQAISLRPNYPAAFSNLGNALREKGDLPGAIAAYRKAVELNPNFLQAHNNLAVVLADNGQLDDAITEYQHITKLQPTNAGAFNTLGNALRDRGKIDESIAAYRQSLFLNPDFPEAQNNLGVAFANKGDIDEAIAAYRRAISLKPNFPLAHSNLGDALKDIGQLNEAIAELKKGVELDPANPILHSNLVYILHLSPDYDAKAIYDAHRQWNDRHARPLQSEIQPHTNDRSPDRPLRVGYVSSDFRSHPVGRFLLPLFAHHDKTSFEIIAYSKTTAPDAITRQLQSHANTWRNIPNLPDARLAEQIRHDKIDILVDLTMHMPGNSLLTFARKPAPVQLTYLAYCSTTGLDAIDYRLTDSQLDPAPMSDEKIYSEKSIPLPTYWCYHSITSTPIIAPTRTPVTFGSLANFCKVSNSNLQTWIDLLKTVPDSHLLLSLHEGDFRNRLLNRFEETGIAPSRIRFVPKVPLPEYFRLYNEIDIVLDTFPYAGGTTTCDALFMGVPVITLAGHTAVGRGGVSILTTVGLPDLIAHSPRQYIQIAAKLAADATRRDHLRSTLREAMEKSPLMNAPQFAKDVETAYRQTWRAWCANGISPHNIP